MPPDGDRSLGRCCLRRPSSGVSSGKGQGGLAEHSPDVVRIAGFVMPPHAFQTSRPLVASEKRAAHTPPDMASSASLSAMRLPYEDVVTYERMRSRRQALNARAALIAPCPTPRCAQESGAILWPIMSLPEHAFVLGSASGDSLSSIPFRNLNQFRDLAVKQNSSGIGDPSG